MGNTIASDLMHIPLGTYRYKGADTKSTTQKLVERNGLEWRLQKNEKLSEPPFSSYTSQSRRAT